MPTYTYRCNSCDYEFDKRQRMSDDPLTDCPSCEEKNSLRKVVNSVGIVFKGSGFYVTDNRNGKGSKSATSSTTSKSNDGDSTSTDSSSSEKSTESSAKESSTKKESKETATTS